MRIFLLLCLFKISISAAWAYETGLDFCARNPVSNNGESRFHEITDPNFPGSKIQIHTYTLKPFDSSKQTILFFTGGPGASPRNTEFHLEDLNVIFFEQRGMGCSRPESVDLFLNPAFYSSEHTIQDAAVVLKNYGISKAVIYGHSYGTVLATMFAHRYPESVSRVILEGVIYRGDLSIWKSEIKKHNLQLVFDSIAPELQNRIIDLSERGILPAEWFSVVGNMMMYLDNGVETYKTFLANILAMEDENLQSFIGNFFAPKGFKLTDPAQSGDGDVTFGMITCQELSGKNPEASSNMIFNSERKLIWKNDNSVNADFCLPLGITETKAPVDLSQYPVSVPVVYLVGENDGATDRQAALLHRKYVARSETHFYLLKEGGHLPNLGGLRENNREQQTFFSALAAGSSELPFPNDSWLKLPL